ncbi:MAG TPA: transcriptional regulator HexR [Arenibaculum sp.]|nr:transcriptional regulator HexR [Arenibaculum sp.]
MIANAFSNDAGTPMPPQTTLLARIRSDIDHFRKSEAKVARVVLADPETAIRSSLGSMAEAAGVSEPTVIRFCRSLDFDGFPDFKIRLAQDIAAGIPFVSPHIMAGDDIGTYARKIFSSSAAVVQATAAALDDDRLRAAVTALAQARRIALFGVGGSAAVALDAHHKLMRLTFECQNTADPVIARMLFATMAPGDAFLALSYTGRTTVVLDLAQAARDQGIVVVAVTAAGSPLADYADVALTVPQAEDSDVFTPMAARIAMLAVVDVLSTGIALARIPQSTERLAAVKRALRATRLPSDPPPAEPGTATGTATGTASRK